MLVPTASKVRRPRESEQADKGEVEGIGRLACGREHGFEMQVLELAVDGEPVVLWAAEGLRSALDAAEVADTREIAATGAFIPMLDGTRLTFTALGDGRFRDDETGSTWDILGRAVEGELRGKRLQQAEAVDTFWFSWAAFHPDTRVVSSGRR